MDILEIKNVTYNYSNSNEKVLSSVNQKFEIGKFYAIIGKSGAAVSTSRFPVGSSAKIIGASETNALAIATLCCCPPDNFITFLFIWLLSSPNSNKIVSDAFLFTNLTFSIGVK